ncbi:MAG: tetratricopeptide repeat protein [Pseudomonadota bacterium]
MSELALAQSAGDYLAGRQAQYLNDFDAVGRYYNQAYRRDPSNELLLERTLIGFINRGDFDQAVDLTSKISPRVPENQIARLSVVTGLIEQGEFAKAEAEIDAGRGVGSLIDGLIAAWLKIETASAGEGFKAFDALLEMPSNTAFASYHAGLAYAMVGDFEKAKALLTTEQVQPFVRTRRGSMVLAQIYSQLGDNPGAVAYFQQAYSGNLDEDQRAIVQRLVSGETLDFDAVLGVKDGVAEVYFSVASALESDSDPDYTLIFARAASFLRTDFVDALLLTAGLLERLEAFKLATKAYDEVPRSHAAYHAAEIGRAQALYNAGDQETAIEVLRQLTESHGEVSEVHRVLGDLLRRMDRFEDSTKAYSNALERSTETDPGLWFIHYARGITYERTDKWPLAEADFRRALELNPGQPNVLNYLGYSMLEKGLNLEEALLLIEEAVAARPNSGFIVDSLGWALFELGRFDEAIVHMERAAELTPIDPVINDHLGDSLWMVGRLTEARFHWMRALSLDPAEEDAERIRLKLEIGLTAVREAEANPIVKVAEETDGAAAPEDDG